MLRDRRIGFVGAGHMCEAIFSGLIKAGAVKAENICLTDIVPERLVYLQSKYGVVTHLNVSGSGLHTLSTSCDIIILALKPQHAHNVISGAGLAFKPPLLVISIMGGVTLAALEELIPHCPIIRVMPNTSVQVGKGAAAIAAGSKAKAEDTALCKKLFDAVGESFILPENLINAFTAVGGCGPAFAYMFIEALADGGVQQGMPRETAQRVAALTLAGASQMVLDGLGHPGQLKDNVCSPAGGTIAGVQALESASFRAGVMGAVKASRERMDTLGETQNHR